MVIGCICLGILIVTVIRGFTHRTPPIGPDELKRLQRFSESRQREDSLPYG